MKTLILSLAIFGCVAAAQADDSTKATKQNSASTKSAPAKMNCSDASKEKSCCSSCCDKAPRKQALLSPKAAAERGS